MNAAILLSDDELRAPGDALSYVKEALADMALSSIRRGGGGCNVVTLQKDEPLFVCSTPIWRQNIFFLFKLFGTKEKKERKKLESALRKRGWITCFGLHSELSHCVTNFLVSLRLQSQDLN